LKTDLNIHIPVLRDSVVEYLEPLGGKIIVDATIGAGGYAEMILEKMGAAGKYIGLEQDADAIAYAQERLAPYSDRLSLFHCNFSRLHEVLTQIGIPYVNGIVFDLGLSSLQLSDPGRGFSFSLEGPLDMRMNRQQQLTAWEIVNRYDEKDLGGLFREHGEERFSKRIAAALVQARKKSPITTTTELARIVGQAIPHKAWPKKIHPATKIFQALRIAVNDEMKNLERGITQAISHLEKEGRLIVLSYHSLEDRIVKNIFKAHEGKGYKIVTKKPIVPSWDEVEKNRRARSAKLRVLERAA